MAAQRLAKEFKALQKAISDGTLVGVSELAAVHDNLFVWRFHLHSFDNGTPSGALLNADLAKLVNYGHPAAIVMEARFPPDYPFSPFFLRVVSPRMEYLKGHVTIGGSVCIEALSQSGSAASWQPSYTVESILVTVVHTMLHCESVHVKTRTGPGGMSGPLRVDLSLGAAAVREYSLAEAEDAFKRSLRNHGWESAKPPLRLTPAAASPVAYATPASAHAASPIMFIPPPPNHEPPTTARDKPVARPARPSKQDKACRMQ